MPEAIYCFDTATVRFAVHPDFDGGGRHLASISEDALRDLFGARGDGQSLVHAYLQHAARIDACALQRMRSAGGAPVVLQTAGFDLTEQFA